MKGSKPTLNCQIVDEMDMIECYLRDKLSAEEADGFEKHYFECDRCFSHLRIAHALAEELQDKTIHPFPKASRISPAKNWWMNYRTWGLAAAAVLILLLIPLSMLTDWWAASSGSNVQILQQLARVEEVPPYLQATIRGGKTNIAAQRFSEGMEHYGAEDYAKAIPSLEEAAQLNPSHVPIAFYLGVSYLKRERPEDAIQQLSRVLELVPNTYQEEAHWFLAKAYFQQGDWESGRAELEEVISQKGLYLEDAQKDLELSRKLGEQ